MITEFVQNMLLLPAEYEFITYVVSGTLLLIFSLLIIGAFLSVFTSMFNNKY